MTGRAVDLSGDGERRTGREGRIGGAAWWGGEVGLRNQYMVSSLAPDGKECACTRMRGGKEKVCAQANARARGRERARAAGRECARAGNQCACARTHLQMQALTGLRITCQYHCGSRLMLLLRCSNIGNP